MLQFLSRINYKDPEEDLSWNINLWTKDIISTLNRGSDEVHITN